MSLFTHSGIGAIDFSVDFAAPPAPKSYSARIAEAELAGIEMPEPSEWEARGRFYPNIHALEATTKDWVYENGLHRPLISYSQFLSTSTFFSTASFTTPIFIGPGTHIVGSGTNLGFFSSPPLALPIEKREMPVIGYRSWKLQENFRLGFGTKPALASLNQSFGSWKKGKNQATCRLGTSHKAGDQNCHCGYYVLAEIDGAMGWAGGMSDDLIVGAVMGWGQVAQHGQEGWRAEYAQVIALLDCKFSAAQLKNTQRIAKAYGVGVFERSGLEAYVAEWGDPFTEAKAESDG